MFKNIIFSSNTSIKKQVITFFILGVSVMSLIISIFTAAGINQQSKQLMLKNAFQITEGLAKQSVYPILSGSSENASDAIKQVTGFQSVIAARLSIDNNETFLTEGNPFSKSDLTSLTQTSVIQEVDNYWLIATPIKVIDTPLENQDSQFGFGEDESKDSASELIIGFAEVLYSKESLLQTQKRITLIISTAGILTVVILSAILNAGLTSLFAPLHQLATTMDEAKTSGEHIFAEVKGAKEIRKMAKSYNNMMKVLDKQDDDLKLHRDTLEKQVEIRTKELILARDTALSASRHKSEFMANISHELRTPIQSIIGYSEIVVEELELEGNFDLIEDMDKVARNAQRLLSLINSLLDLAKIEAGHLDVHNSTFTLTELAATLSDTIAPLAKQNNNIFIVHNECDLNEVTLDKDKLEQALLNLLSNACKFTDEGHVSLTISNEKSLIRFSVKDSGIGLDPEQQQYIFDAFRQVDGSQSRKFGGTGLGLAITKRFIELMKGQIYVKSNINEGAEFTIELKV